MPFTTTSVDVWRQETSEGILWQVLRLRTEGVISIAVNEDSRPGEDLEGGYPKITRSWSRGDVLRLEFPMPARVMESHPCVCENVGRVALMRGPTLYCLEGMDHPGLDLDEIVFSLDVTFTTSLHPDLLGGVVTIQTQGMAQPSGEDWQNRLYRQAKPPLEADRRKVVSIQAIPYYAWGNRDRGQMQVGIRR